MHWKLELLMMTRAVVAAALGALVGWQRERAGQEAGIRTFAAVSAGACVYGLTALIPGVESSTRVAAQVVSGVGFLCTGVVLHARGHVRGLTTAASIWVTASIGLIVSYGLYLVSLGVTLLVLGLLALPARAILRPRHPGSSEAPDTVKSIP